MYIQPWVVWVVSHTIMFVLGLLVMFAVGIGVSRRQQKRSEELYRTFGAKVKADEDWNQDNVE